MKQLKLYSHFFLFIISLSIFTVLYGAEDKPITFAVIGDYGSEGSALDGVAKLVNNRAPDFIITVGDNNYPDGKASTIDKNVGQYFSDYIAPYSGSFGSGADSNRFFPALGNHDWRAKNAQPYLDYFTLPGNERYYDFIRGPVHFFVIDSDPDEPDGNTESSVQAQWLKDKLAASTSVWKIVYFHHPPYSSGKHGPNKNMQWPFAEWGASLIIAGHDHIYERIERDGITYIVNGLGGRTLYDFGDTVSGSVVRYNKDYGAMFMQANQDSLYLEFQNQNGERLDAYSLINVQTKIASDPKQLAPNSIYLGQNYPNPFNPVTTIRYAIDKTYNFSLQVNLSVYNVLGEKVSTLVDQLQQPGTYVVQWSGTNSFGQPMVSGIYFYRLEVGRTLQTKKMILVE